MVFSNLLQEAPPIKIKGTQDGLMVTVSDAIEEPWLSVLEAEFAAKPGFWRGGRVVLLFGRRAVDKEQLQTAMDMLEKHGMRVWAALSDHEATRKAAIELSLAVWLPGHVKHEIAMKPPEPEATPEEVVEQAPPQTEHRPEVAVATQEPIQQPPAQPLPEEAREDFEEEEEHQTAALILKETLRSGRSIRHAGPVIVLGDVNPGAEVLAGGDVIVWGKLRGLVHAGAWGDTNSVVCALDLNPTQLRIADKISVPPKDPKRQAIPETAIIRNGQIIAEAWRPKV